MKIKRYLLMLAAATGLVSACQKQEMVMLDMSQAIAPVMHDIDSAGVKNQMIITAMNQTAKTTFTWDAADFGVETQIDYSVEVAVGDGPKKLVLGGITKTEASHTYEAINQVLYNDLELKENVLTDVNFYIGATVGAAQTLYSEPVVVKVSCTAAEKQYPKIYVVGEFNGWNHGKASYLFDFAGDDATYQGLIDFGSAERKDGGFKITPKDNWDAEWGLDAEAETEAEADETVLLTAGGSNINIYQLNRFYHFSLEKKSGTLTKGQAFNTVGMIGTAVGGWDADVDMEFDATTQKFWADVTLTAGELKFRADDDWAINWGVAVEGKEMLKGTLDGDKNITVPAGNYRVYLNLNNSKEASFVLNADKYGAEAPVVPGEPELSGEKRIVYFKPASNWMGEGISFHAWIWPTDGTGSWYPMTDEDGDGIYAVEFPKELDNIIFASMNGDADWANKVNQTGDLKIPSDDKDTYVLDVDWMTLAEAGGTVVPDKPTVSGWGIVGEFNEWGSSAEDIMLVSDGTFLVAKGVTFDGGQFKFRKDAGWDVSLGAPGEDEPVAVEANVEFELADGGKNMTVEAGVYDVYLDEANSKAWFINDGSYPGGGTAPVVSEWGIIGVAGNWENNVPMYEEGDWIVARGITFSNNNEFKFRKGNTWGTERVYEGTVSPDAEYACAQGGGNSKIVTGGTYDVYLAATLDKFYIMTPGKTPAEAGEPEIVYVDASAIVVGLSGSALGWDDPSDEQGDKASFKSKTLTDEEKFIGTYVYELSGINVTPGDKFKVRIDGAWIGMEGATVEGIALGDTDSDNNFVTTEGGLYTVTITFEWDGTKATTVTAAFSK